MYVYISHQQKKDTKEVNRPEVKKLWENMYNIKAEYTSSTVAAVAAQQENTPPPPSKPRASATEHEQSPLNSVGIISG